MDNFEEYLRQGEPNKAEKAKVWKTAIGLQQIDGLKPSNYLIATAKQNIEGDITIGEVKQRIDTYYIQHPTQTNKNHNLKNREMHIKFVDPVNDPVKVKNDPVNESVKSKILQHLKQNSKANYRELAGKTGNSQTTIKRHIQELKKMGIIERIGSDKTGYWKIAE